MKVFTTINPNGNFDSQNEAISSWSKRYKVYSVNTKDEIEKIKDIYPNVTFVDTNDTFDYNERKLIKLNSILSAIEELSNNEAVAIVNSDIILNENIELNINKRYLINGIFIGTRYELDGDKKYPFIYGYDVFIFNSKYTNIFKNDKYVIGMPWWDYWIPIIGLKRGLNIYHIKDEFIYHRTHDTNYDMNIWRSFGENLYNDLSIKSNISFDSFLMGKEGEQMDIKKFIESKQINISVKIKQSLSQIPIVNKKEKFTICSYYFNFKNDIRQKDNLIKFLEQFSEYYENMVIGIVDYDDIDFELPCKSIKIKGDCNNKIWSKEILINKVIDEIDTEYIMWIDADLIYQKLDWLKNIDSIVGDNDFVQLFENINYLNEKGELTNTYKSIILGCENDKPNIDSLLIKNYKPGGAWLGKTSILKENKLFEKMYVGGGDTIFVYGLFGVNNGHTLSQVGEGSKQIQNEAIEWINNFGNYKVGYLKETINHLYHGDIKDRNYIGRYKELSRFKEFIELKYEEFEYDFCIIITTYNRPEMLRYLLDDIEFSSLGKRILVTVFDDGSDIDYDYLDKYDIKYVKYIKNNGKVNYWKLVSDTFKYCGKIKSKYYIYLPDDIRLKNNFFEESIRIFEKIEDQNKICLNLLMDESRRGNSNWTGFTPIEYDEYYKTQWNDLCFISKFDFFEKINFEILPISKNRWLKNSELGSGVGQQMSMRLLSLNQNMYHVINSLVTHGEHDSKMNYEDRQKVKLIAI
jgi:hypothetical protein